MGDNPLAGMAQKAPSKSPPGSPASPKSPQKSPSSPGQGATSSGVLPAHHWAQEPVLEDDAESALGESIDLSTASITSSILNYRTLHGRRYHSDVGGASYWGSNDKKQNESMDLKYDAQSGIASRCGDKLHLAPLEKDKVRKVIDIGTGTGTWAIDFADEFPEAEVVGTDISPIQPTWVPPNLKFEIEDCTQEWTFSPDSADYIHMRWLIGSIADWDALFAQAYRTCKPGGWVETFEPGTLVESDQVEIPDDSAISQWGKFFIDGGVKLGRPFMVTEEDIQRKSLEAAGFVDIQEFVFKRPLGSWPKDPILKEIGTMTQITIESDAEGYILFLANLLGWTQEEVQVYISHYRREVRSNKYCPYYRQKVLWGRKPEQ